MKRTQADHVDPSFAEGNKIANHLFHSGGFDDGLYGITGNHNLLFFGEITKK